VQKKAITEKSKGERRFNTPNSIGKVNHKSGGPHVKRNTPGKRARETTKFWGGKASVSAVSSGGATPGKNPGVVGRSLNQKGVSARFL